MTGLVRPGEIVDLSHPLPNGAPGYPGDPGLAVLTAHEHGESGYHVSDIHIGSHVGTHIDVPLHVFDGGEDVLGTDLHRLVGPARLIDLGALPPFAEIGPDDVGPVRAGERIVLKTGWARTFGTGEYHDAFPQLSVALAERLAVEGILLVGIEQPSVHHTDGLAVHRALLGAGVVIVEGMDLSGLDAAGGSDAAGFFLTCLPLPIESLDGCPVRAIATALP